MKEKDREPAKRGPRRQETGDRETGRGRGPEDPTAAWDPDRTLPAPADARGPVPPAPASELSPGDTFGSYRLEARLGRGGFGEVWEAVHSESGRRVALKLLTSQGETTPEARERFHREARLAASVSHPHCVFLFGAEEVDGPMALAMEIMEGGTLQDVLDAEGRLPYRRAVDAILDLVDGLEAAEKKGIIHRDIKPSNCFLDASGGVKIGDFGLSKTLEADEALTVTGTYLGTPAYSSPEQVRGREIDFRSDVFSLGALLYHLVAGERPFGSGPATHTLGRILFEDPKPPSEHGVEVPKGLVKVIRRMMAKEPGERYPSYDALRRALVPFSSQALTPAVLPKRFGAYLLDFVLLEVVGTFGLVGVGGFDALTDPQWSLQPRIQILAASLVFLYFFLLEGLWRASLGKRLLGLRVLSAGGDPPRWPHVAVRTGVFVGFPALLGFVAGNDLDLRLLAGYGGLGALLLTMRRRNGYAGIHELLSGTRVMTLPAARPAVAVAARQPGDEEAILDDVEDLRFGPYQVLQPVWSRGPEELLEGFDPLLERRVWIHVVEGRAKDEGDARRSLAGDRPPAHLQWLQAGAEDEVEWNAYEHLDGSPLLAWGTDREPMDWPDALLILRHLARALADEGGAADLRSLAQVWVEPGGRVRLLPFTWPSSAEGEEPEVARPRRWQALLQGASSVLLHGRLQEEGEPRIGRPLPWSLQRFLERLGREEITSLEEADGELARLLQESGSLSRGRRASALIPAAFILSFFVFFAIGLLKGLGTDPASPRRELPARLAQWHALEDAEGPEATARREAVAALLAQGYFQANTEREPPEEEHLQEVRSRSLAHRMGHFLGGFVATGSISHPTGTYGLPRGVSKADEHLLAELAVGREELEPEGVAELRRTAGATRVAFWMDLAALGGLQFVLAVGAILLAAVFRGGLGLRLALIHIQRHDGELAARLRCALRAFIAWSPFVASLACTLVLGLHHPLPALLAAAAPLLLLAGALYAVWHPTRALQDRLAGTWLMPR